MFLAAGSLFCVPQTWMVFVQIKKTDLKAFICPEVRHLGLDDVYTTFLKARPPGVKQRTVLEGLISHS